MGGGSGEMLCGGGVELLLQQRVDGWAGSGEMLFNCAEHVQLWCSLC